MSRPPSQAFYDGIPVSANGYGAPPVLPPKPTTSIEHRAPPPLPPPPPFHALQQEISELPADQAPGPHGTLLPSLSVEPTWTPSVLLDKSTSDLQQVLSDPSLQAAVLNDPATSHPAIAASQAQLEPIIQKNIALATSLEALGTRLASQRAATQARLLALRALEQQHRAKIAETEAALHEFSPGALYQRLNASALEQEQLLRGIEQSWIEEPGQASERELSDWVKRVKDASREAFLKKERKARWDEGRVGGWK